MNKRGFLYIISGTIAAVALGFGAYQYNEKMSYRLYLLNDYQHSFIETVDYVENVDNMLNKVMLARKPQQSSVMFAEIWKLSDSAKNNLGNLPYNHVVVSDALKYLSQVSDFSYSMLNKTADGNQLEQSDWEKVAQIKDYSSKLSVELNAIATDVNSGGQIDWTLIEKEGESAQDNEKYEAMLGSLSNLSKQFQEYPSLIYDGPFSEHIRSMEPLMTKGKAQISSDQGIEVIKKLLKDEKIQTINLVSETDTKAEFTIPVYSYEVQLADQKDPTLSIDITKQGGYPLWLLNFTQIPVTGNYISTDQALTFAENFLKQNNYPNMKNSYYEIMGDSMVINFAPFIEGTIMYPDLVKVKVSLIDGTIIGLECMGYLMMHHDREIPKDIMTQDQAKEFVSNDLKIKSINKAIIPLDSKKEVFCYEFVGKFDDKDFIVYINAKTGKQEQILQLLINENGILTQ